MGQKDSGKELNFVRIAGTDLNASLNLSYGLTKIKGISFMFANALCHSLKLDKNKKINDLTEQEVQKIEEFLASPQKEGVPEWLLNQRKEFESGKNLHIVGKDLDFNLMQLKRRLSKIKSYRGLRLRLGLTVRGQRTKNNFRKSKTIASMKSKSTGGKR